MKDPVQEMVKEADSIEWDCIYSSKGHFNSAMLWSVVHYIMGGIAVVCAAVAGKQIFNNEGIIGSALAFVSAGLTALITFLKPIDKADPHHKAGTEFAALRRAARIFQNIDVHTDHPVDSKLAQLKELAEKVKHLNQSAPPIPFLAYQITRRGVRRGEATYNEDGESKS
jgi:hypothetical protein